MASSYRRRTQRYETQKSLNRRFLFVLHLCIILTFIGFALFLIFARHIELSISYNGRLGMAAIMIVYAITRFIRSWQKFKEPE